MIDETHDVRRQSWVQSASAHPDFPIQNLPLGIFSVTGSEKRIGSAIGDSIIDLSALGKAGFLSDVFRAAIAADGYSLNGLFALGKEARKELRRQLSALLEAGYERRSEIEPFLFLAAQCELHLPARIGGYTDFFAGINHARNAGRLFRPDNPLLPNYKYVPVGYHGRTSSIQISGENVRRPNGQTKKPDDAAPVYGPSRNLDYELELGFWIAAGNSKGTPIPIGEADDYLAGVCLLNDWSARDIQAWEYQPLGPFLAKNFATTISPWVVTSEALEPFKAAQALRPEGDPAPLPHLFDIKDQASGAYDIKLEATLSPVGDANCVHKLSSSSSLSLYWTVAQLIAHHTSGGCNLQPGDLIGSGTISGEASTSYGSLLEITRGGREATTLANGESRTFLCDGDTVVFRGYCERQGFSRIGFGECRGTIKPALKIT